MQSKTYSKILSLLFAASSLRAETVVTEAEFLAAVDEAHPAAVARRAPLGQARGRARQSRHSGQPEASIRSGRARRRSARDHLEPGLESAPRWALRPEYRGGG